MRPTKRKILIVALHYSPDFVGVPKFNTELAEALRLRGHDVEVVTGLPHYPAWRVPPSHARSAWRREVIEGVPVFRTPLYVPRTPGGVRRILHLFSFGAASMILAPYRAVRFRPDLVFTVGPTLLSAAAALVAAKFASGKSWLHIQDFEVDAAFELGMLRGRTARTIALGVEAWLLKAFDRVSSISPNMVALLERKGVAKTRAVEFRNWVNVAAVRVLDGVNTRYRKDLDISPGAFVALYSGNMAAKQGLERLAEVAALVEKDSPGIIFLFCGGGPFRAELERLCDGRTNVRFLDLQPTERLTELFGTANVHLLPQRAEAADLVLPSKLTGMLASGRPVIAMAQPNTSLAAELAGCGVAVEPSAIAMADALRALEADPVACKDLGCQARLVAEQRWDATAIIDGFECAVEALCP